MATPAATGNVQTLPHQNPQTSSLLPERPHDDPFIIVESMASSGLPERFPKVGEREARGTLYKAATKVRVVSDLLPLAEQVFDCGWPDVTISFRRAGESASDTHVWTLLAPRPDRESPGHGEDHEDPCPH